MNVNPKLIAMARESRGLTQSELSDLIQCTQSKLSKQESGAIDVGADDLSSLSSVLRYTEDFFLQATEEPYGCESMCVFHRKRANTQKTLLKTIQAKINIFRLQVARLTKDIHIELSHRLHRLDVDQYGGPIEVARELRRLWKLPTGPINNLVNLIERAGVIVIRSDLGTGRIDAVSQIVHGYRPVFIMNSHAPGDRLRFSLCHELGHIVMHQNGSMNKEEEADKFAAEFLMPANDIKPMLSGMALDKAATLKPYWKVSMASLIKRAGDLEKITPRHCRTLFTQMSSHGWRIREPVTIQQEIPTALQGVLSVQINDHGASVRDLARRAFLLDTEEFVRLFAPPVTPGSLRVVG